MRRFGKGLSGVLEGFHWGSIRVLHGFYKCSIGVFYGLEGVRLRSVGLRAWRLGVLGPWVLDLSSGFKVQVFRFRLVLIIGSWQNFGLVGWSVAGNSSLQRSQEFVVCRLYSCCITWSP